MAGKRRAVVSASPSLRSLSFEGWFKVVLVAVALSVLLEAGLALKPYLDSPTRDLSRDVDWHVINQGLGRIHGFRDTWRWWSGPWCGMIAYWRPLTSYVFWTERLLWPIEYMLPREIILVLAHLCFVAMSGMFLWRLTNRRWLSLLTVWLFAGYRPFPIRDVFGQLDSVVRVLSEPKNIPDPLAGMAVITSLILLMRGRWMSALAIAVVGVCFKEISFVAWPLAIMVLAWVHRDRVFVPGGHACVASGIRHNWVPVAVWSAALVALIVLHFGTVGPGTMGHITRMSFARFAMYLGGPIAVSLILRHPSPACTALLVYTSLVLTRRRSLISRFIAALVAVVAGMALDSRMHGVSWDVSGALLLSWRLDLTIVLACLVWLLVVERAPGDRWTAAFGIICSAVASVPTWCSAYALEHTRYVSAFFMEIGVAAALLQSVHAVRRAFGARRMSSVQHR